MTSQTPQAMATSSSDGDGAPSRGLPLPWGSRWRNHLQLKTKCRAHSSISTGLLYSSASGHHVHGSTGSLLRASSAPSLGHSLRNSKTKHAKSIGSSFFRRYDAFPMSRYRIEEPFRRDSPDRPRTYFSTTSTSRSSGRRSSSSHSSSSKPASLLAFDLIDNRHVLLTIVPKAAASGAQIDHVHHAMLTLARFAGFQRLLAIWEHDGAARKRTGDAAEEEEKESCDESTTTRASSPSWVFVQEFERRWIPLDLYCDADALTEDTLRRVTFEIVSMLHFLHAHRLSASGQLCASHDFVVHGDTQRIVWLVAPTLVLSGCLLAHATPVRCARDVSSIGYVMFHLSMVPHAPSLLAMEGDAFEELIQDHLRHLSLPCRAMMIGCLTESPTLSDLIKSKWLRHVDFVSIVPKLGHSIFVPQQHKRLALHALLWKLVSFFAIDWLGNLQQLGAFPSALQAAASTPEDEELESPRRSVRKSPSKRVYVNSHAAIGGQSFHHQRGIGGGRPTATLLKQGMVIVPPLGSAIMPHDGADDGQQLRFGETWASTSLQPRSFVLRGVACSLVAREDAILEVSAQAVNDHKTPYDSFAYDFPLSPSTVRSLPEYDAFHDLDDDDGGKSVFSVDSSALDDDLLEDQDGRRRGRAGSLLLHENGHAGDQSLQSVASLSDLRSVVRSLHHPSQNQSWSSGSDEERDGTMPSGRQQHRHLESTLHARAFADDASWDPVLLSAFGPRDIARRESFRIDIWAYLRQQRREMLDTALERNESEVAQRVQPLEIARGTLITVSIDANDRFGVVGDACKTFRWRGDVNGVSFDMVRTNAAARRRYAEDGEDQDDLLCIARVVAGTKVALLFIRLRASSFVGDSSGDSRTSAVLSTHLEHVVADVPEIASHQLEPLRPIGTGAFGEAMLALWKERNVHVVVKTPHRDPFHAAADSAVLDEFRHEAAVMQMLGKHPHVVELLGITTSGECAAIVTEFAANGSLHDFLTRSDASRPPDLAHAPVSATSPLSLFSRTVMARDAAHGIANIHQGHVLHRDIAARNCLLDSQFRVKVCDFGLSRLSSKTHSLFFDDAHHGFGPIKWMAPESVLPPHLFSTHSDAYMFGVLLYEIFSGELPFAGVPSREAMALVLEGQHVPIPAYLPHTHRQLMAACFDPHPLARPSMDQIYTTLDQWILQDTRHHSRVPVGIL